MKNKLSDLNDHLFMVLERLNSEELGDEGLEKELKRAKGVVSVAQAVVANASVQLMAYKVAMDNGEAYRPLPATLSVGSK